MLHRGMQSAAESLRGVIDRVEVASAIPRAGFARQLATHVAREFGVRRVHRRVLDGLVVLLEAYNEEMYRPEPMPDATARRLARSILDLQSALQRIVRDESIAERALRLGARALSDVANATVPECVMYVRAIVVAGVVAGEVTDPIHAQLDQFAVALGLAWEASNGELTLAGWRGGLALLGRHCEDTGVPPNAEAVARQCALEAVASLEGRDRLLALFEPLTTEPHLAMSRQRTQYEPVYALATAPPIPLGAINEFATTWRPRLDQAMRELVHGPADPLVHAAEYLRMQGGKRLRGLVTLAAAAANGADCASALPAAAAIEWLHQTSLILDDIVDEAWTRRGAPCLHRVTTPAFAAATSAFMLVRCAQVARALPAGVSDAIIEAKLALLKGECLEVALEPDARASLNTYYRIIEAKTASLFECAATVGASCAASPSARSVRALRRYGREIGLAFQIVDDLLDYIGDERLLGKKLGTDFRNGRLTLPAILLAESNALPDRATDFDKIRRMVATGEIAEECRRRARMHIERALDALPTLPGSGSVHEGRAVLEQLAWTMLERSS